ncbi:MAG: hypothetical protein HY868_05325 [Chloroflexi bacterium]|nr:hypothetical protein [Chloroflexota bacterium]
MIQQVIITSEAPVSIKPLVESAIRNQLKTLEHGSNRTRERLAAFEKQFGMPSDEFEHKFQARELDEDLEFIDWLGEIKTLRLLQEQLIFSAPMAR